MEQITFNSNGITVTHMVKMFRLDLDIPPTGKASVRVGKHGSFIPPKTRSVMDQIGYHFKQSYGGDAPYRDAVRLEVDAYYKIPVVIDGIRVNAEMKKKIKSHRMRPVVKPDYDNVLKLIGDSLTGLAWLDDKQIVESEFRSWFAPTGRTVIRVLKWAQ